MSEPLWAAEARAAGWTPPGDVRDEIAALRRDVDELKRKYGILEKLGRALTDALGAIERALSQGR